jgi:uncharacterized membrane protein YjjB (DUF3815 family)
MAHYLMEFFMGLIGVWGFAVLFRAPGIKCLYCGILGALDWVLYLVVREAGMPYAAAITLAIFVLVIASRAVAAFLGTPATIFVVTGIFPLVPGAGIYYTAYYFVTGNAAMASQKGSETVITALSIALGIILANVIPQACFTPLAHLREGRAKKSGSQNE